MNWIDAIRKQIKVRWVDKRTIELYGTQDVSRFIECHGEAMAKKIRERVLGSIPEPISGIDHGFLSIPSNPPCVPLVRPVPPRPPTLRERMLARGLAPPARSGKVPPARAWDIKPPPAPPMPKVDWAIDAGRD